MKEGDKVLLDLPTSADYIPCIITAINGEMYIGTDPVPDLNCAMFTLEVDETFLKPTFQYENIPASMIMRHTRVPCQVCNNANYQYNTQVILKAPGTTERICNTCYIKKYGKL